MSKVLNKIKNSRGFTLIELLVVIAIIALLATLAVVSLNNARQKSRDAKRVSDIKQIQTALDLYYLDQNAYPTATNSGSACTGTTATCGLGVEVTCLDSGSFDTTCSGTVYMGSIPRDPSMSGNESACAADASAVCDYAYQRSAASTYSIYFYLEGATGNLNSGVHCASQNGIGNALSSGSAVCP